MGGRARITDVAVVAGVSNKTVSRVINGVSTVEPGMRRRVEAVILELNYVPNTLARSLKSGAGNTVGVVVDSINDVFFSSLVSAVEGRAVEYGRGVVICSTGSDAVRAREQLLRLTSQHVRGIIIAPVGNEHAFMEPYKSTTPLVTVDRTLKDSTRSPSTITRPPVTRSNALSPAAQHVPPCRRCSTWLIRPRRCSSSTPGTPQRSSALSMSSVGPISR